MNGFHVEKDIRWFLLDLEVIEKVAADEVMIYNVSCMEKSLSHNY